MTPASSGSGLAPGPLLTRALGRRGTAPALITDSGPVSFVDLAARVGDAQRRLGDTRRLVLLRATNDVDSVVWILAALAGRHPVLLASATDDALHRNLADRYDPDVSIVGDSLVEHRPGSTHDLHPSLAVLMSTSGTSGSPKLVRLSRRNLLVNARSIVESLGLTDSDRAITVLAPHYCYGLSVLTSHLLVGGSIVLNRHSVIDDAFWQLAASTAPTNLAGVPYTFEQLDRIGFTGRELPSLRLITQAGGRMDPDDVRRYARLGTDGGWSFVVMYGQTEATARMAYLPPHLAIDHPASVGVPIPRGSVDIDDGELVYSGPNVMLGYAHDPVDLARGRTIDRLHTGDRARVNDSGLIEITGRRSRILKIFGQRIDLDHLQDDVRTSGLDAHLAGDDRLIAVAATTDSTAEAAVVHLRGVTGLPVGVVRSVPVDELPRTASGKVDDAALIALAHAPSPAAEARTETAPPTRAADAGHTIDEVRRLFARELGVAEVADADSFADLGGDSLSYVRVSIELEDVVGELPRDWHTRSVADLAAAPGHRRWLRRTETSVLLRGLAIVLIVATHIGVVGLPAGGHTLLAVAGFNFARFHLPHLHMGRAIARIAIPSLIWIWALFFVTGDYPLSSLFLVHNSVGAPAWSDPWRYWFIDAVVQMLIAAWLLLRIPGVRRIERSDPFRFALGTVVVAVVLRYDPFDILLNTREGARTLTVLWAFALGWAAAVATTHRQRLLLTPLIPIAVQGFFASDTRNVMIMVGLTALLWLPHVPVPRLIARVAAVLASASLYIYLTHWEIYGPVRDATSPLVATAVCLAAGVAVWLVIRAISRRWAAPSSTAGTARYRSR